MEIISFNEAATANGRIEKFIENPDSNSGIVTVPKVIGAGESVTVPAGRVAVLPNVQVDGELVVDGEVFIPSGAGLSTVVQKSGDTMTGSLTTTSLISTGALYSNDGTTTTRAISSGGVSYIGTITNHPLVLQTGNTERMRIDTSGNVGIGTSDTKSKLSIFAAGGWSSHNLGKQLYLTTNNSLCNPCIGISDANGVNNISIANINGTIKFSAMPSITDSSTPPIDRLAIDTSGNVLVTGSGGLGYGTGSGGTVTQLTSKSTAVTLNKPCGKITMHNASLAANTGVAFYLNNSLIGTNDLIVVNIGWDGSGDPEKYSVDASCYFNGGVALIYVKNITAGALAESISINFALIKGAKA